MNSFVKWLFSPRCEFCGAPLLEQKVYTARAEITSGLASAVSYTEGELYDCVDCPKCGRQHLIGKRYRREE